MFRNSGVHLFARIPGHAGPEVRFKVELSGSSINGLQFYPLLCTPALGGFLI